MTVRISLAWGHPTNFSMWSGDIQYSKLYNLAEISLNFKSAKIHFKHHFSEFWHFWNLARFLLNCTTCYIGCLHAYVCNITQVLAIVLINFCNLQLTTNLHAILCIDKRHSLCKTMASLSITMQTLLFIIVYLMWLCIKSPLRITPIILK